MISMLVLAIGSVQPGILYSENRPGWISVREMPVGKVIPDSRDAIRFRIPEPKGTHSYGVGVTAASRDNRVFLAWVGSDREANPGGPSGLWLVVRGRNPVMLYNRRADLAPGQWVSPDGSWVAYAEPTSSRTVVIRKLVVSSGRRSILYKGLGPTGIDVAAFHATKDGLLYSPAQSSPTLLLRDGKAARKVAGPGLISIAPSQGLALIESSGTKGNPRDERVLVRSLCSRSKPVSVIVGQSFSPATRWANDDGQMVIVLAASEPRRRMLVVDSVKRRKAIIDCEGISMIVESKHGIQARVDIHAAPYVYKLIDVEVPASAWVPLATGHASIPIQRATVRELARFESTSAQQPQWGFCTRS